MDSVPLYCLDCGRRRLPTEYACPAVRLDTGERCGCSTYADHVPGDVAGYVVEGAIGGILAEVATLPPGSVLLLYGPAGGGKTTAALGAFDDAHFASSEMGPPLVAAYARRLGSRLYAASWMDVSDEGIDLGIRQPHGRPWPDLIADSASSTRWPLEVLHAAKDYAAQRGTRAIVIAHVTKAGDVRGSGDLLHDADVIVELTPSRVECRKNRFGAERGVDVQRRPDGQLIAWQRTGYYSVEGTRGSYRLERHPRRGARHADVYRWAKRDGLALPPPPLAVTALRSDLYPDGWAEPDDVDDRRAFAASCGVAHFSPLDLTYGDSDDP